MEIKRVDHETYERFWEKVHPNFSKVSPFTKESEPLHFFTSFILYYEVCIYNWLAAKLSSFEETLFIYPIKFLDRPLKVPQECHIYTDSAQLDPDCNPTTVFNRNHIRQKSLTIH